MAELKTENSAMSLGKSLPAYEVFPDLYPHLYIFPVGPSTLGKRIQLFNALRPLIREPNLRALEGGNVSSISEYRKDLFATPGGMLRRSSRSCMQLTSSPWLLGLSEDPVPSGR